MGVAECGEMEFQVGRCGVHVRNKPYEQAFQSIIIKRKLTLSVNCFEETIKSISTHSDNLAFVECGNIFKVSGTVWETLGKQTI